MDSQLVVLKDSEPVTTTLVIAEGMNVQHPAVIKLVKKYQKLFEEKGNGTFQFSNLKSTGGRPELFAFLNEENAAFLITLMRNSEKVIEFKSKLTKEFVKQRRFISELYMQKKNAEWIEQRKRGIVLRKEETDIIQEFVDYAVSQGSQHAQCYYMNISKMENKALFFISEKYPNLRNIMDNAQLVTISAADQIVVKALRDGMAEKLNYKDIYQKAKDAVETFAGIIGKSVLPKVKQLADGKKQIEIF